MQVEWDGTHKIIDFYLEHTWLEGMSKEDAKKFAETILNICGEYDETKGI